MQTYDAKYYWDKYKVAEAAWHIGLDKLHVEASPLLVGELLAVHKLMDILRLCAEKHEGSATSNPRPHSSMNL